MPQFKRGDKVVHLGGALGLDSPNRGKVLTILDGPYEFRGYKGERYIVDKTVSYYNCHEPAQYHTNAEHLLLLK